MPTIEKPGKTIHLLKAKAKPSTTERKRRKIPIKGGFGEYQTAKAKKKAESYELNIPGV